MPVSFRGLPLSSYYFEALNDYIFVVISPYLTEVLRCKQRFEAFGQFIKYILEFIRWLKH